jgi:DNA repair exonuclease SbcCD ATPase subunit
LSQSKKIFTRMCLNNWGGINHKVLQFNEYVNLFSGKSGSGKSTVMDAIQVILYGSFSSTFLNKAADDAKNRRSVLSYLRGEQKDGSANRGDCDFCSVIALEIEDTGSHTFTCIGIAFEVRKNDSEIKRFVYFSHSGTIETISEQLDAYRQIREKIEDMRKRIELLKEIKESGQELVNIQSDIVMAETMIRCIDIEDMRARIQAAEDDKKRIEEEQIRLSEKADDIAGQQADLQQEYIQVCADLKSSDLGSKKDQLRELEKRSLMLTDNSRQWIKITNGLKAWDEDEVITDYVSNAVLNLIEEIVDGDVTEAKCQELHLKLESIKKDIEDELEDNTSQKNEITKELKEKKRLVDDMKNNRKSYSESLRSARAALQRDLSDRFGEPVKVQVFADMFDVQDEEWKNAIEGRMGRLKFSLITEPRYAHTAAVIFRDMKQFEDVDLINSKAIMDSEPKAMDGSLYEAVDTKEKYVDVCLKRYLGHIIKCRSVDELEQVRDGVTPDCYSYSNFIFRHLKKRDYTTNACIGGRVSKARLAEYEADVERLEKDQIQLMGIISSLKAQRDFECLKGEPEYFVGLSEASDELKAVNSQKNELEEIIRTMENGQYKC